jgi:protoheme IX farnesyltransferase
MIRDLVELTKPRITVLILICTGVGYFFGLSGPFRFALLLHVLLGTALMASGTAALNQWYESDSDSKMRRTRNRPMAAGRIQRSYGFIFAAMLSVAGFADLWLGANPLAAEIGLLTLVTYIGLYTPLKRRSAVCTTIGAIPGALPPLIGYAAASGTLDARAAALFLILFVWQFPHFYAIAWMYRDDYARGGIKMLPVIESDCESTARRIVGASLLLVPISLIPAWLGMAGAFYSAAAIASGLALLYFGVRLSHHRTLAGARYVLLASVMYLPAVLAIMVLDCS